jgi:hypothetical protein
MNNLQLLLTFILVLGILILIFYNYLYLGRIKERETLISDILEINQTYQETIPLTKLFDITSREDITLPGSSEGEGLTFIWNMYIPYFTPEKIWFTSYDKDKPLIRIGDSPQILYNPRHNSLKVQVKYKSTQFMTNYPIIELKDIPLQKWNKFIVVIKTNVVKFYINGELKIHKKLVNPLIINNDDINLGEVNNNIIGKISNFEIVFRPLDTYEIKKEF